MPLIVFHTRRVREALKRPEAWGADIFFLLLVAAVAGGMMILGKQVTAPYRQRLEINLSILALPKYTLLSLGRGFAAYVLSLIFTLVYGTVAAHNHRAEKLMLPALDVLQAIPVLGFLPGLVLAMISLFPTREIGLEIACIVMIFTAQAWNMTFSFHGSLRGIPTPLREVAAIQRLSKWQIFRLLEVPAAMIGLVWNSMMSMAGGWFFLTVNEAFTLGDKDYRLPGIGSYMNEAINKGDTRAGFAAVVAMIIMIIAVDQLFWRPIVVWSQRFKLEEQAQADAPQSWVLNILTHSRLYKLLNRLIERRHHEPPPAATSHDGIRSVQAEIARAASQDRGWDFAWLRPAQTALRWIVLGALALGALWGAWVIVRLLTEVPFRYDRVSHEDWISIVLALLASFVRTTSAVAIGAAWALPVGILIGRSPVLSRMLQPVIQVVASFPAPMLFPVVTLGLAAAHVPFTVGCVALMLLGAQWYILFNVIAGASAIPHDLIEVADVYRMWRAEQWFKLYIPCVFPYLVTGLITAAGGAWNATIVSEYVQLNENGKVNAHIAFGLGSLISGATNSAHYAPLAAGVVTMAAFVVLLNRFFWKRLYRLAEDRYSLNV
ncbi:MAG TPA: ABC transporter permease subunit [Tepidisphaeraceae bacterium]|nr:ABC transporter permease subunit [Tepidisphaeraceae bacterium]